MNCYLKSQSAKFEMKMVFMSEWFSAIKCEELLLDMEPSQFAYLLLILKDILILHVSQLLFFHSSLRSVPTV